MHKPSKQTAKKNHTIGGGLGLGVSIITGAVAAAPIAFYIYLAVNQSAHPQSGAEYGFIVLYPFVIAGSLVLLINGILLLVQTVRKPELTRQNRIFRIFLVIIFLAPGLWFAFQFGSYQFVKWNANRIVSNQEVLSLVQECKVDEISRGTGFLDGDSHTLTGKINLKKSAQTLLEQESYFYGYRTFDANYYDTLFKITQSTEVRQKCGEINYRDDTRETLPPTVKWASFDEAKQMIDSCSINEIFTRQTSENALKSQTSNPQNPTGIFMTLRPSSHGYFGRLYIASADQSTRSAVLDFANKKKPVCVYHLPNIIDSTE